MLKELTQTEYNTSNARKYIKKKRAAGWRYMAFIVPPNVYDTIAECKRQAMTQYRIEQLQDQLKH